MCPKRERLWTHNFRCMFLTLFHRISQSARWSSLYCHAKQQCTKKQMKPQQENKKGNTFFPHTNQTNKKRTRQDKAPTKKTKKQYLRGWKEKKEGQKKAQKENPKSGHMHCSSAARHTGCHIPTPAEDKYWWGWLDRGHAETSRLLVKSSQPTLRTAHPTLQTSIINNKKNCWKTIFNENPKLRGFAEKLQRYEKAPKVVD